MCKRLVEITEFLKTLECNVDLVIREDCKACKSPFIPIDPDEFVEEITLDELRLALINLMTKCEPLAFIETGTCKFCGAPRRYYGTSGLWAPSKHSDSCVFARVRKLVE